LISRENKITSRIIGGGGVYFGIIFISSSVSLVTLPILLNNLTVEQYATFALISVFFGIFGNIFDGGAKSAVTIEYNNFSFESEGIKNLLGLVVSITVFLEILFCILIFLLDSVFHPYQNFIIFEDFQFFSILKIAAIMCLLKSFTPLMSELYKMREEPRVILYYTILISTTSLITIYYYVDILDHGIDGAARSLLITSALGGLVCMWLVMRKSRIWFNFTNAKEILSFSLPLVIVSIANWAQQFSDRILIEVLLTNTEMAIYHLGSQMSNYMIILGTVVFNTWTPIFFEAMKNNPKAAELVSNFTSITTLLGALGVVIFVEIGDVVLGIISPKEYTYSTTVMSMIACSVIPSMLFTFNGIRLVREKKTFVVALVSIIGAILSVVLNFFLLPEFGLFGAALSSTISYTIIATLVILLSEKVDDIKLENYKLIIAGFVVIIAMATREVDVLQSWHGTLISLSICATLAIWALVDVNNFRGKWGGLVE